MRSNRGQRLRSVRAAGSSPCRHAWEMVIGAPGKGGRFYKFNLQCNCEENGLQLSKDWQHCLSYSSKHQIQVPYEGKRWADVWVALQGAAAWLSLKKSRLGDRCCWGCFHPGRASAKTLRCRGPGSYVMCLNAEPNPLRQARSENIIAFTVRAEGYNKSKCHSSIKINTQSHLDIEGMELRMTLRMRF